MLSWLASSQMQMPLKRRQAKYAEEACGQPSSASPVLFGTLPFLALASLIVEGKCTKGFLSQACFLTCVPSQQHCVGTCLGRRPLRGPSSSRPVPAAAMFPLSDHVILSGSFRCRKFGSNAPRRRFHSGTQLPANFRAKQLRGSECNCHTRRPCVCAGDAELLC